MPINIEYNPEESIQIVRDVYGNPTTYRYDDRGNVLEVKNALGFSTFFEYDANNNLTQTRDANNLVTKYEYDTRGNLTSKTEAYCGCAGVVPGTTYYTYDARGQMQDLVLPTGASMHLSYDAHGNMLSMTDGKGGVIQSFTYYDNGLVKTETDTAGTTTYEYNNFGDVIKTIDNQQTTYTWNDENRLVAVQTADGKAIGYTYNINGIRVSSTVDGVTTQYLVDSNRDYAQVLEEYVDGVRSVSYVYGRDLISQERSSVTSFYLVDGLGSTTALADANGNITDTYSYEAFGELKGRSGSTENSYRFTGEQWDTNLGEYYLRQRYYDSETGRFTRRDIYEGRLLEPLTLHKYLYAHANATNLTDPSGLTVIGDIAATLSIFSFLAIGTVGLPVATSYLPASIQNEPPSNNKVVLNIHTDNAAWGHTSINVDSTVYSLEGRADEPELRVLAGDFLAGGSGWFYRKPEAMWRNSVSGHIERYALTVNSSEKQRIRSALDQTFLDADMILGLDERSPQYYRLTYYHAFARNCNTVATEHLPFQFRLGAMMTHSMSFLSPQHLAVSMRALSIMPFTGIKRLPDLT